MTSNSRSTVLRRRSLNSGCKEADWWGEAPERPSGFRNAYGFVRTDHGATPICPPSRWSQDVAVSRRAAGMKTIDKDFGLTLATNILYALFPPPTPPPPSQT